MSLDIVIRPERADHPQVVVALAALDDYLRALYPPEANHILSTEELLAPDVSFFAAWQGDRVIGTGAVRQMAGERETGAKAYGEVKRMYVDPSLRGRRVGARLVEALEASMRARGLTLALLETGRDQHQAVRLYERCGYRRRGPFGGYPDNGLSLFLAKVLAA
jgi:putative acetyltransferase